MSLPGGNDENTLLLLHGEDLTDSSQYNHAVTNNGLSIDTSIKKFGKSSLYASATTKNLSIQYNQMFDFGTGDFTFDFWMYLSEFVKDITVISGSIKGAYGLGFYKDGKFGLLIPGVEWNIKTDTPALTSGDLNQWVHWAAVRLNGTVYLFKNGTLLKSAALTNSYTLNGGNLALLTEFGYCGIVGYIDEFRISNIARWTEDFTPPTEPYSNPAPPSAPTDLQHTMAVHLVWSAVDGATSYNVYRDGAKLGSTETTQYVDTTPEANQTYVYTVKAVNGGGESAGTSITVYTKSGYFEYKPLIESANFP